MKRVVFILFILPLALAACGGSGHNAKVEEVPIDQNGGGGGSGTLPPDEVGDSGVSTSTVVLSDASAPPGVGPQSLDVPPQQDSGAAPQPMGFVQRTGGLTQKDCTDMVMQLAKLTTKENHAAAPLATDIPKDPIYGQMLSDCGQQTTKKQQKCAMAARTSAAWKKCME